jgi:outer membrane protein assembly factor BamB
MVSVPGLADNADAQVVTAAGSWLLVVANSGYASSSGQLVWFNPATGAERWLTRVPRNVYGDSTAIPFYSLQSAICDGPCF